MVRLEYHGEESLWRAWIREAKQAFGTAQRRIAEIDVESYGARRGRLSQDQLEKSHQNPKRCSICPGRKGGRGGGLIQCHCDWDRRTWKIDFSCMSFSWPAARFGAKSLS